MSNQLPHSIDSTSSQPERVALSGSRFLHPKESPQDSAGIAINPEQINTARVSDGYRLIGRVKIGDSRRQIEGSPADPADEYDIIDMREISQVGAYKDFRGLNIDASVPYILVGKSSDATEEFDVVGLRPGGTYRHGRATPSTPDNDRRRRFAASPETSREQFAISVNESGVITVVDTNSANGTTVEWGINEPIREIDEMTKPRPGILGVGSLSVQDQGEIIYASVEAPQKTFSTIEEAMTFMHETTAKADIDRRMGALAETIINESDASSVQIKVNAQELLAELGGLYGDDTGILDAIGINQDLKLLADGIRRNNIEVIKYSYAIVVRIIGDYVSKHPRWFAEKMDRTDNMGYKAGIVASVPEKHLLRAIRFSKHVGDKPILEFLRNNIK